MTKRKQNHESTDSSNVPKCEVTKLERAINQCRHEFIR